MNTRGITAGAAAALLLTAVAAASLVFVDDTAKEDERAEMLRREAGVSTIERHLAAFDRIARKRGGDRAAGGPGFNASVRYVVRRLEAASYEVTLEAFKFTSYRLLAPTRLEVSGRAVPEKSFTTMVFSPSGRAEAPVARVGAPGPGGCVASDFAGFPQGAVAVVNASNCAYVDQAANAEAAGATALLVAPRKGDAGIGVLRGTLGQDPRTDIPVVGITYRLGRTLVDGTGVEVVVSARAGRDVARNVIAQTPGDAPVLMLGAHLDSAVGSPGINDNGSGSATLLALAEAVADEDLDNAVRFGWWGAEEYGLLGSLHYVRSLSESEREKIGAYLNFDMTGSPNFVRYVYEGDGEPEGSEAIEEMFVSWFEARGLKTEAIPLRGRSDHAAFARFGTPVGGIFTGANMLKTRAEVRDYGGAPGTAEDPCYHLPCDDLDNVDRKVLAQMAAAAAHAVAVMANTPGVIP